MAYKVIHKFTPKPSLATPKNIAIVGGGIAGLASAYRLLKSTSKQTPPPEIHIYEANNYLGGRIYTIEDPFDHGGYLEGGAELIDSAQSELIKLANELGLEMEDIGIPDDPAEDYYYIKGNLYSPLDLLHDGGAKALFDEIVKDHSRSLTPEKLHKQKKNPRLDWSPYAKQLDSMSLDEYLDTVGTRTNTPPELIAFIKKAYQSELGKNPKKISALAFVNGFDPSRLPNGDGFFVYGNSDESLRIKGGTSQLTRRLHEYLEASGVHFHLNYQLQGISESTDKKWPGVDLHFNKGSIPVDGVILTLPMPRMKKLEGLQAMMPDKQWRLMQNVGYGCHKKVMLELKDEPWKKLPLTPAPNGVFCTDNPYLQHCWITQRGPHSILTCFVGEQAAFSMDEEKLVDGIKHAYSTMLGGMAASDIFANKEPIIMRWPNSYVCPAPNQYINMESLPDPVCGGRVQFAGDACNRQFNGFMGAAVCSARHAAHGIATTLQIDNDLGKTRHY
ncbi:MAG: NAD(P)/FAD-dependent oxidoreductase [Rickettsiales bacterium]|nr:NAD(P)/FAD-dependent oxidoreductase [Rickettsiales bacterium]